MPGELTSPPIDGPHEADEPSRHGRLILTWTFVAIVVSASVVLGVLVSTARSHDGSSSFLAIAAPAFASIMASSTWVLDAFAHGRVLGAPMGCRTTDETPRVVHLRTMSQACNLLLVPLWTVMAIAMT